ncbi:hypothetical protein [Geodermatophilus sp. SYSU D01036]
MCPPTATDLLVAMVEHDGAQTSAAGARRALADPAARLHAAATRYADALRVAAEHRLGAAAGAELETAAARLHPGLPAAPAWPTLRGHLALLALSGADPVAALRAAAAVRELDSARDPAAVLDWRLPAPGAAGPLPWQPAVPAVLADDPHWGLYLAARADHLTACAARVAATAAAMTSTTAPGWAQPWPGGQPAGGRLAAVAAPRQPPITRSVTTCPVAPNPSGPVPIPVPQRRYASAPPLCRRGHAGAELENAPEPATGVPARRTALEGTAWHDAATEVFAGSRGRRWRRSTSVR